MFEEYDKLDYKCLRCKTVQQRFNLCIDCTTCKHYIKKIANGEIEIEIELEDNAEEE